MASRGDRPVLHPTGHARKWHHRPGWHRAAIRLGTILGTITVTAGIILAPLITGIILAVLAAAGIAHQTVAGDPLGAPLPPLPPPGNDPPTAAITKDIGATPAKLEITYNQDKRPIGALVGFGEEYTPGERDKDKLTRVITTKLAIEAPAADWSELSGKKPQVTFRPCDQPPPAWSPGMKWPATSPASSPTNSWSAWVRNASSSRCP